MNNFIDTPPANEANSVFNAYRLSKPFVHQLNASRLRIASAYGARVTKKIGKKLRLRHFFMKSNLPKNILFRRRIKKSVVSPKKLLFMTETNVSELLPPPPLPEKQV